MPLISVEDARTMLPQVGDRLCLAPTLHKGLGNTVAMPRQCVVEYVNYEHLWYMVRYDLGFTECFHVPETEISSRGRHCTDD